MINRTKGVMLYFGTHGSATWETTAKQNLVNYNGDIIPKGTTFRGYVKNFGGGPVAIDQAWFINGLGSGYNGAMELYVEDSSFIRINNISLSYNFSSASFQELTGLSNLRLAVTAYNPFLWTNYSGVDPSTNVTGPLNGQGMDYFNPPGVRSILFSLSLNI